MEFLTDILSGGLFGLLGSVVTRVTEHFTEKQRQSFKREEWGYELKLLAINAKASQIETENELKIASEAGSWQGLAASYKLDERQSYPWVDAVRSLVRPALTLALVAIASYVLITEVTPAMRAQAIDTVLFLTATAVAWWFGDRAPGMKRSR